MHTKKSCPEKTFQCPAKQGIRLIVEENDLDKTNPVKKNIARFKSGSTHGRLAIPQPHQNAF